MQNEPEAILDNNSNVKNFPETLTDWVNEDDVPQNGIKNMRLWMSKTALCYRSVSLLALTMSQPICHMLPFTVCTPTTGIKIVFILEMLLIAYSSAW